MPTSPAEVRCLPSDIPQYLFDDSLIAHQQRLVRRWLPATVYPYPVLEPDRPWEGRILALFGSVLPDPAGGYRLYYCNFTPGQGSRVMLATSADGFRWEKPALGLVDWQGSRENNLLLVPPGHLDSPSVMHDPADAEHPYKLLAFQHTDAGAWWGPDWGLYGHVSADGLLWQALPGPLLQAGDRTNLLAQPVEGTYVAYTRHARMFDHIGCRAIYRSESSDFRQWTEPALVLAPDLQDEPEIEFYGMSVFQRHGWYFGLLEYWNSALDVIETHLALSRDGVHWQRTARAPFIAATYEWNRAWSSCASNGPLIINEQMVFYFGGRWVSHGFDAAQQYGAVGYASLPTDRFCALEGSAGGRMDTVPLVWPGGDLAVNADTRESFTAHPMHCSGEIAVDVLDADGRPLPDWSGDQRAVFRGNTHCRINVFNQLVKWPGNRSLDALKGQPIRLSFHLRHARLFTFEARTE